MSDPMPNPGSWGIFQGSGGGIALARLDEYGGQTTPIKEAQGGESEKKLARWLRDYDRALTRRMADVYGLTAGDETALKAIVPWAWPRVYSRRFAFLVAPSDKTLVPVAAIGTEGWRALREEQALELIRDPKALDGSARPPGGFVDGAGESLLDQVGEYMGLPEGSAMPSGLAATAGLGIGGGAVFFGWDALTAFFKRAKRAMQ